MGNELLRSKERMDSPLWESSFCITSSISTIILFRKRTLPCLPASTSTYGTCCFSFFQGKHTLSSPCSSALPSTCKAVIARNGAKTSETGICGGSSSCWDSGLSTLLSSPAKSWCFTPSWDSYWFRCGICRTRRSFGLPAS